MGAACEALVTTISDSIALMSPPPFVGAATGDTLSSVQEGVTSKQLPYVVRWRDRPLPRVVGLWR